MSLLTISSGKITDSASIVPIKVVSDVTTSREFGVSYLNNTRRTLFVLVTVKHEISVAGGNALIRAQVGGIGVYSYSGIDKSGDIDLKLYTQIAITISPDKTYRLDSLATNGANTLIKWIEAY